jgi:DnaJ-class molecular chaperone
MTSDEVCPKCKGTKYQSYWCSWTQDVDVDFCEECKGTGKVKEKEVTL